VGVGINRDVDSMCVVVVVAMVSVEGYTIAEMLLFSYAAYGLWILYSIPLIIRTWIDGKKYIGLSVSPVGCVILMLINQLDFRLGTMMAIDGIIIGFIIYEIWWLFDGSRRDDEEVAQDAAWRY
jgi:hypothetical protein